MSKGRRKVGVQLSDGVKATLRRSTIQNKAMRYNCLLFVCLNKRKYMQSHVLGRILLCQTLSDGVSAGKPESGAQMGNCNLRFN